jgi:hypothetical protein
MKKMKIRLCIGDFVERLIHYSTFGFGKKISTRIANWMGFEDCGCSKRQTKLNELGNCYKRIKLN